MMKAALISLVVMVIGIAGNVPAQESPEKVKLTSEAFEHYEGVRAGLAADNLSGIASHAKALAAPAESIAGPEAKSAAERLAAAKTLEDARKHFGDLSTILVPIFQRQAIPGTTAYVCGMNKKSWIQKGNKIENPYFGKSMLTCGSQLPAKSK